MAIKHKKPGPRFPVVSALLMGVFLGAGSLALVWKWPPGPANLDWGVWILAYFGYLYVIGASLFYVRKNR
ncbi:MAG: hypothetical protein ACE5LV_02795 [Candidatus Aminicenantales bacterium]